MDNEILLSRALLNLQTAQEKLSHTIDYLTECGEGGLAKETEALRLLVRGLLERVDQRTR